MCRQVRKDICYLCYKLTLTCPCYVKYLFEPDDKAAANMLVKYMSNKYGFMTPYLPIVFLSYVNKYQLDNPHLKINSNDIELYSAAEIIALQDFHDLYGRHVENYIECHM